MSRIIILPLTIKGRYNLPWSNNSNPNTQISINTSRFPIRWRLAAFSHFYSFESSLFCLIPYFLHSLMTLLVKKPVLDIFGTDQIAVCGNSLSYKILGSKSRTKSVKYVGKVAAYSNTYPSAIFFASSKVISIINQAIMVNSNFASHFMCQKGSDTVVLFNLIIRQIVKPLFLQAVSG